jgi:nickel-dependent lactate racemase
MTPPPLLSEAEIEAIVARGLDALPLAGKRVLVIIPDQTRTMPVPLFFRLVTRRLRPRARAVDFVVALGTHPPLGDDALLRLVGLTAEAKAKRYADVRILNHAWQDPAALTTLGALPAAEVEALSGGRLSLEVPVRLNRLVLDYDHLLICGPVFPHEVAGFSGGNKYFFPGLAGAEVIDFTHWLGALVTSSALIGVADTPVRRAIDRAAGLIPRPRHALCCVVTHAGVEGVYVGAPEDAWRAAADHSARVHIRYLERPYRRVLSVLPEMYDELWVGGKGMYKLEPVVADGGEVVLYAPHLRAISRTHGALIRQVGYHVRDYFTAQWERFRHYPWGVLAHSTHVRGLGAYDARTGVETPRIQVTLATALPESECRAVNLGYRDPASIDPRAWEADPETLVAHRAGEILHRLSPALAPDHAQPLTIAAD